AALVAVRPRLLPDARAAGDRPDLLCPLLPGGAALLPRRRPAAGPAPRRGHGGAHRLRHPERISDGGLDARHVDHRMNLMRNAGRFGLVALLVIGAFLLLQLGRKADAAYANRLRA